MDRGQHNTLLICTFDPDYELSSVLQGAKEKSRENRAKESILPACDNPSKLPMQETSTRQCIEIHFTHTQTRAVFSNTSRKSSQNSGANVNKSNFTASVKTKSSPVTMYFFGTMKTWQREGSPWLRKPGLAFTLVGDAPRRSYGELNESIQSQSGGGAKEWVKVYYRQASGTIRISNHRPDLHGSHPSTPHRFN